MTYNVLMETFHPTHSLTPADTDKSHWWCQECHPTKTAV